MNYTLSVFLRDEHGFSPQMFSFLLVLNAFMVVTLQFWIAKRIKNYSPLIMIAIGTFFYAIGFSMFGFLSAIPMFFLAIIIITIGEMILAPFSQSIVAHMASEDKRGRYMAVSSFSYKNLYSSI